MHLRRLFVALILVYVTFDFADVLMPGVVTFDGDDVLATAPSPEHRPLSSSTGAPPTSPLGVATVVPERLSRVIVRPQAPVRSLVRTRHQTYQPPGRSSRSSEDH